MEERKTALLKCLARSFGAYTVINFLWTAIWSIGASAGSNGSTKGDVAGLLDYLVSANAFIALFSIVFGFSFLVFRAKNMSQAAKRTLHILINYVVSMVCYYGLHSQAPESSATVWVVLLIFATFIYFAIYGIAALVAYLIRRKKAN